MKKSALTLLLTLFLSTSVLADGEIPIGGKSCPNGQTTCLVAEDQPEIKPETPIYKRLTEFLKFIFG